jgi:hypothetical protein
MDACSLRRLVVAARKGGRFVREAVVDPQLSMFTVAEAAADGGVVGRSSNRKRARRQAPDHLSIKTSSIV